MQSMRQRISYPHATQNSFSVDIDELLDSQRLSFLIDKSVKKEFYYNDYLSEFQVNEARKKFSVSQVEEQIVPINEMTAKEIRRGADVARLARSKDKRIICNFVGVTDARGWLKFLVSSQYTVGKKYTVYIKLKEASDMKYFKEFKKQEIIRLFLSGDIQIHCTCLRGGTKIKLLNGSVISVEEMLSRFRSGEELWVYSVDEEGNFKPGKVNNVFISGVSKRFIRVYLDSGKYIDTTEDHMFMKRDGSYIKASELEVGTSLMPLYFKNTDNGYELVKFNKWPDGYHSVYKEVANEIFTEDDYNIAKSRSGEDVLAIHHIDYNKSNNNPNNLRLMGHKEHIKLHADFLRDRMRNDIEFRRKNLESVRKHIRELNENPTEAMLEVRKRWSEAGRAVCETDEWKGNQSVVMREAINKYWRSLSKEERSERQKKILKDNPDIVKKQSDRRKKYWENLDPEVKRERNRASQIRMSNAWSRKAKVMSEEEKIDLYRKRTSTRYKKIIDKMIESGEDISESKFLSHFSDVRKRKCVDKPFGKYFKSLTEVLNYLGEPYSTYNHKVVKIEYIDTEEELVYDISVDKYHNFYVDAGVIVHNCADFKYRMKYQAWQMGYGLFKELRYPHIVNPGLTGSVCKHCLAVLRVMSFNHALISKKMINSKFFKKKYEDEEYMSELEQKMKAKKLSNRGRRSSS